MGSATDVRAKMFTDSRAVTAFLRSLRVGGKPGVDAVMGRGSMGRLVSMGGKRRSRYRPKRTNVRIAAQEAAKGRDPWHLDNAQARELQRYAIGVCDAILAERRSLLQGRLQSLGTFMLKCFDKHFESSESVQGAMSALPEKYVKQKLEHGYDARPLIKSGTLRRSVKIRVRAK
jgi:hypothetical protein